MKWGKSAVFVDEDYRAVVRKRQADAALADARLQRDLHEAALRTTALDFALREHAHHPDIVVLECARKFLEFLRGEA